MKPWMYPQLDQMGIPIIMIERYAFQIAKEDIERDNKPVLITRRNNRFYL